MCRCVREYVCVSVRASVRVGLAEQDGKLKAISAS